MEGNAITPTKQDGEQLRARDPLAVLGDMQAELERFWQRSWGAWPFWGRTALAGGSAWAPRMDVYQKDDQLVLKADLPGLTKDDVEVTLDNGDLVVRGERKQESEVKEGDYYRAERRYGSFHRRLSLGFDVAPDQVKASFQDGVLEVMVPLPKPAAQPEPTRIPLS
jgi:HSP20 family protein